MNEEIVIKELTADNEQSCLNLFKTVLFDDFADYSDKIKNFILGGFEETFQRNIRSERQIYKGAFVHEQLVGLIQGEFVYAGVGLCVWLMVDKTYQHHGIGTKLLQSFEEKMKDLGVHSVHLYAPEHNIAYYQSRGYELIGQYKKGWFGVDDYMLAKTIQEPKEENFLQ